jgi:hypothetical protein
MVDSVDDGAFLIDCKMFRPFLKRDDELVLEEIQGERVLEMTKKQEWE